MALIDPNDYTVQPSIDSGTHEIDSAMQRGGFIGALRSFLFYSLQWYIWRALFYGTLIAIAYWFGISSFTQKELKEASTHLASGGLEPVIETLNKRSFKSTKLNIHPYFKSDWAKWFKSEFNTRPKEIYQFARHGDQEFFIMKDVFHGEVNGKRGPLLAEFSTLFGKDAENYCESHGGFVAKDYEVKQANVQRVGEGFVGADDWNGKKMFRCTIIDLGGAK